MLIVATLVFICGVSLASASEKGNEKTPAQAEKQLCPETRDAISFYRSTTWKWQKMKPGIGLTKASTRQMADVSCKYARWVAKRWQERSHKARVKYEQWRSAMMIPLTGDWFSAVMISQRVFPKTASWLMLCSKHEGGHGLFKMNTQGSPAGGWMQFYASTYYANQDDAREYVKSKGFIVDSRAWNWKHPLGQALTAGYMRAVLGNSHVHWSPQIDIYCI
jgi:hypothetical protein